MVQPPPVPMPTRRPEYQHWEPASLVALIASTFWLFMMLMVRRHADTHPLPPFSPPPVTLCRNAQVVTLMARNVNQVSHRRQSHHRRGSELQ